VIRLREGRTQATISVVVRDGGSGGGKPLPLILARELASNLATPMFLIDAHGVLVFYNDAAAQLIGKAFAELGEVPAEEFGAVLQLKTTEGEPLRRRDSPAGVAFFERKPAHRTVAATGYDGVERLVHATAYPLFGSTGEMHGVVSVFWQVDEEDSR
jgi:PAS domain-containing protein